MGSWIRTVRFRMTMLFIATVVVANLLVSTVTLVFVRRVLFGEVKTHIRTNLVAADGIYDSYRKSITDSLRLASLDDTLTADVVDLNPAGLALHLETIRQETDMDVLWWVTPDGRVAYRARNPAVSGDDVSEISIIARASEKNLPISGTIILPPRALMHERLSLPPAPAATIASPVADLPAGTMAVAAAIPVARKTGGKNGIMFGARLLNQRFEIVDRIRGEVFSDIDTSTEDLSARVTIFQGPVRIATTVDAEGGKRAVGTQMSDAVRDSVLGQGLVWSDRAFVIDRWFLTAYEPLRDPEGKVIGALGLGLPEGPLFRPQDTIFSVFISVVAVTTIASLLLLFVVTQSILTPITSITGMLTKIAGGDLSVRVSVRPRGEMGLLVEAVNGMADGLARRQEQLDQALRRQLGRSEKLASIGRLAAGIAHEVNNPLTGVLTFASLLKKRPALEEQDRQDLDLILRETTRVRDIVKGLLEFARETPSKKEPLDVNEVIRRTMALLKSQKEFYKITVVENMTDSLAKIDGDKNQVQQVLLNLSLNACEAMPNGGTLTITTLQHQAQIIVSFSDTGAGIKPEHMDRIFEPFFTTKPVGKGTGLGLSVSYGIIQQHNGTIEVESAEGRGTTFTLTFPALPNVTDG